ncbi:WbqC-like protein family protein [Aquiflexum balticum DSM 16537]|uniref:WbqC-like protein family protein n=1 Tax=Aquiflexum balticum DSM 16537 TaxID=758820 RepID=A0A1W2HB66_9BACT|nr:WbqC family protein [Aquiflexum balticum]SMD45958.1 WbqC-like protein family protein [Aquiflexum balticum DSM 16537]
MPIITDLFYLPPIEYFVSILGHKEIIVDGTENYQKQTYRNRARILLTNKVEILSIPVFGGSKERAYKEIKIDYGQKWKNVHLRGIQSAYGKAPFFEFFFPYLEEIYNKNLTFLFDHNFELLTVCLKLLQLDTKVSIGFGQGNISDYVDKRGTINTKEEFTARSIMTGYEYSQMFGVNFVPNLSVLDLLFCQGTESKEILVRSKKND